MKVAQSKKRDRGKINRDRRKRMRKELDEEKTNKRKMGKIEVIK